MDQTELNFKQLTIIKIHNILCQSFEMTQHREVLKVVF